MYDNRSGSQENAIRRIERNMQTTKRKTTTVKKNRKTPSKTVLTSHPLLFSSVVFFFCCRWSDAKCGREKKSDWVVLRALDSICRAYKYIISKMIDMLVTIFMLFVLASVKQHMYIQTQKKCAFNEISTQHIWNRITQNVKILEKCPLVAETKSTGVHLMWYYYRNFSDKNVVFDSFCEFKFMAFFSLSLRPFFWPCRCCCVNHMRVATKWHVVLRKCLCLFLIKRFIFTPLDSCRVPSKCFCCCCCWCFWKKCCWTLASI